MYHWIQHYQLELKIAKKMNWKYAIKTELIDNWSFNNHYLYPDEFKITVYTLLLSHYKEHSTLLYIPKDIQPPDRAPGGTRRSRRAASSPGRSAPSGIAVDGAGSEVRIGTA